MRACGNAVVSGSEAGHMFVGDMYVCTSKSCVGFLCLGVVMNSMRGESIILINRSFYPFICMHIFVCI